MTKIIFKNNTYFSGRNGTYTCTGIVVEDLKNLLISPITSKGQIGRCEIAIDKESIPELIVALNKIITPIDKAIIYECDKYLVNDDDNLLEQYKHMLRYYGPICIEGIGDPVNPWEAIEMLTVKEVLDLINGGVIDFGYTQEEIDEFNKNIK